MSKPKPRGRAQRIPAKDRIMATFVDAPNATRSCGEISGLIGISTRNLRNHLYSLMGTGELFEVRGSWAPILYTTTRPVDQAPPNDDQPIRVHRPVGTWERKNAAQMAKAQWFEGVGA